MEKDIKTVQNSQKMAQNAPSYNPEQGLAIKTRQKDILVAAGAGCGKTFVMIERIADNIIQKIASVDQLLVVTYTKAAASEMRVKLSNKINDLLADPQYSEQDKKYLRTQADLIGQSDICTLHKFCQNIIQKYFYVLDLDAAFAICDESEANILRNRALKQIFDEFVAAENDDFLLLAKTFDDKRGFDKIAQYVYKIYEFLNNQPDICIFREKVNSAFDTDLNKNKFAQVLNKNTVELFSHFADVFGGLLREAKMLGLEKLVEILQAYVQLLSQVKIGNSFEQNLLFAFSIVLPALPRTKAQTPEEDDLRADMRTAKTEFSDALKKVLADYTTDDISIIKHDILAGKRIVNAMLDLVELFRKRYLLLKKERNLLDFSDLEHYAYQILSDPVVNAEIHNKYKQIYVDEYQDVNDIQEGILNKVHNIRDIFLVGDVKQSIYGFRNTNPQIFLDKLEKFGSEDKDFGSAIAINLNHNYRSDQKVLDYVNWVFGILMTKDFAGIDYSKGNVMNSASNYQHNNPAALPAVEFLIVNKTKEETEKLPADTVYTVSAAPLIEDVEKSYATAEAYAIYNKIIYLLSEQKTIYDAKKKIDRPIQFGDITILARTRSAALMEILDCLSKLGLPIASVSKDSVLDEYEVKILLSFLELIEDRANDVALLEFLVSPVINLDEEELCKIRQNAPDCEFFYQCVLNYKVENDIKQKLDYAFDLIEKGQKGLINGTIYQILIDFCQETGFIELISSMSDGSARMSNAMGFVNSFVGSKFNYDLCDFLANLAENNGNIKILTEPNTEASVIGVATMHQSKGLEYPIVFMVDCGHNYNMEDKKGDFLLSSELGIGMYTYDTEMRTKRKTILHSAVKVASKDKDLAERQRLLYVAMTRAKNHLFISGAIKLDNFVPYQSAFALKSAQNDLSLILSALSQDEVNSLKSCGMYTQELNDQNHVTYSLVDVPTAGYDEKNVAIPTKNSDIPAKYADILHKNASFSYPFPSSIEINLRNSVTGLNSAERNRLDLQENFEDAVELAGELSLEPVDTERGTAFHRAMQVIDFALKDEVQVFEYLNAKLTPDELKLVDCGKIFQAICNLRPKVEGAKLLREQEFLMRAPLKELTKSEADDEVLVRGIIDLVVLKGDEIVILDYKTSNSFDLERTARGYATQLRCYQKAVESVFGRPVKQKFLYFFLQERLILIDND